MGWKRSTGIAGGALFALVLVVVVAGEPDAAKNGGNNVPAAENATNRSAPVNDAGISAAEFAALRTGMTLGEVVEIVGSQGEVLSESELSGIRTVMVKWNGEIGFGANANAMFQNDKLIQKSQFGLE